MASTAAFLLALFITSVAGAASTTFAYDDNLPNKSEAGQAGTNHCGTGSSGSSQCQNVIVNGIEDFCLYGPPTPGKSIGETERYEVAYCLKSGYGTRVFPNGTIKGAHFVKTPEYVQITGWGDFTKIGVKAKDAGGELDPHGADGKGNPIGGLVFGNSYGKMQQYPEWTNFMSATEFCIRVCNPESPNATKYCAHRYDIMGCYWNMPSNYDQGYFESCEGDSGEPMGIYTTTTTVTSLSTSRSTSRRTTTSTYKTTSRSTYKTTTTSKGVKKTLTKTGTKTLTRTTTKTIATTITKIITGAKVTKTTTLTWHQGQNPTPQPHPIPKKSKCFRVNSVHSGNLVASTAKVTTSFTTQHGTKSDITYAATFTQAGVQRKRNADAPGPARTAF